jgi:hypothetical protein
MHNKCKDIFFLLKKINTSEKRKEEKLMISSTISSSVHDGLRGMIEESRDDTIYQSREKVMSSP